MPVDSLHTQYAEAEDRWQTVNDVIDGQDAIKKGKTKYLPKYPGWDDNKYKWYKDLAYFVNITGRTKKHLVGAVFRKDPEAEIPPALDYVYSDINGAGQGLEQIAKKVVGEVLEVGREGILVDYPRSRQGLTRAEVNQMGLKAYLSLYAASSIINWRTETVNGRDILTLVVLKESVTTSDDGFEQDQKDQYRVLKIDDGAYIQEIYDDELMLIDTIRPSLPNGESWREIPFVFVGAEDNTPDVDMCPLYELATVNIAHYRSIADREAAGVIFSQMMLHVDTGEMSAETWKDLNPDGVIFGASGAVVTNGGGSVNVIQASANDYGSKLVLDKAEEMVSVGARLIDRQGANQTAEAARINASSEMSVLDTVVGNVSDAITKALMFMAQFMGVEATDETLSFELNTEFFDTKLDPQAVMAAIQLADRGDISQADMRSMLRRGNWISDSRSDEAIDEDLENESPLGD